MSAHRGIRHNARGYLQLSALHNLERACSPVLELTALKSSRGVLVSVVKWCQFHFFYVAVEVYFFFFIIVRGCFCFLLVDGGWGGLVYFYSNS